MPPKKEPAAKAGGEQVEGEDPAVLLSNYQKLCKAFAVPVNNGVAACLNKEENGPCKELLLDSDYGTLGCGGTRALMTAILGSGPAGLVKGGPYKLLNSIRLWRCSINDEGAAAVAEVLRLGGAEVRISYLEILHDNISTRGCLAIGSSLSKGKNLSLLTLKLDYNCNIGTAGVINLCNGIRTNMTLKQLHLSYCKITSEAGVAIADMLKNASSNLTVLNLAGNMLGGKGVAHLCDGLIINKKLENLSLSDNMIDGMNDDGLLALNLLNDCILVPDLALTSLDLSYNMIGQGGAELLLPGLDVNKTIKSLYVDATIPLELFERIFRDGGGGKKGKKGKKK